MARPAPTAAPPASEEEVPIDPDAVARNYRFHRARRAAKARWHREKRWAGVRFWIVLVLVVSVATVLAVFTLSEIERVFGL